MPIIEAGEEDSKIAELALKNYLIPLLEKNIDTLILGCTHYGLLRDKIQEIAGKDVSIVSEGNIVAEKTGDYLKRHPEIESLLNQNSRIDFLTTDLSGKFSTLGKQVFWTLY